jgi:uncharacterized protein YdeI (YjbR/CyaY-like superfamily)
LTKYEILYVTARSEWRAWLEDNYNKATEIWLVYPKKSTGKPRILYNDAVEEALCFGWIDSIQKTLDKDRAIQRFTPRNPKSDYSQANKERLKWLSDRGMIHPSVAEAVKAVIRKEFVFPPDIIEAIKMDLTAWRNYQPFSDSYKRIRIAYIEGARDRPEEFKRRLSSFIKKTRENKLITGHGGIDKYYN